jgi:hypothetical protein
MLIQSAVFWGITPRNTPEDRRFHLQRRREIRQRKHNRCCSYTYRGNAACSSHNSARLVRFVIGCLTGYNHFIQYQSSTLKIEVSCSCGTSLSTCNTRTSQTTVSHRSQLFVRLTIMSVSVRVFGSFLLTFKSGEEWRCELWRQMRWEEDGWRATRSATGLQHRPKSATETATTDVFWTGCTWWGSTSLPMFPYILYSLTQQNLTSAYQICQWAKYKKAEKRKSLKVVYIFLGAGRLASCVLR